MRRLLAASAAVVAATPAIAHPLPLGIGGFPGGLLHPLFVPAHLMGILALALMIGTHRSRIATLAFSIGLGGGLGVMTLGVVPLWLNEMVLGLALVAALGVALALTPPEWLAGILAVVTGFCIALDSPPETISLAEANLMLLGTGLGASAVLIAVSEAARRLKPGWPAIAARIAGSWIAASALLALVLRFTR